MAAECRPKGRHIYYDHGRHTSTEACIFVSVVGRVSMVWHGRFIVCCQWIRPCVLSEGNNVGKYINAGMYL